MPAARAIYLKFLTPAFALFSSARVVAYLPTIWAIHETGDASQHSVWTWLTWAGGQRDDGRLAVRTELSA